MKNIIKIVLLCGIVSSPVQATLTQELCYEMLLSCVYFHSHYDGAFRGISVQQRIDDLENGRLSSQSNLYNREINQEDFKCAIHEFVCKLCDHPQYIPSFLMCVFCAKLFFFIGLITLISLKK